ncbi:Arm DNA-binding domain-containing protein [Candidatus Rariloculus sp.]|uniref:Arm DNA-binding domain-containing protein n=1 Tax=Candidatus Rariloculus sp. TaxID=3101265 RepID=UPI003D0BE61A
MLKRSQLRIAKRTVDALRVAEKDTLFWDRDLAGFGVRVHATGRKVYLVQSRGPAGLKRVSLGRHGELSPDEARKRAAAAIDRIKRGEAPVEATVAPVTVAELAERFMRFYVAIHLKPKTAIVGGGVGEKSDRAGVGRKNGRGCWAR